VAVHPDHPEPVGACVLSPPSNFLHQLQEHGTLSEEMLILSLIGVRKLAAVAVDPEHRAHAVGQALLRRSTTLAFATGITTVFGQVRTSDNLDGWYRKNGYAVFAPAHALDLSWLYNRPTALGPPAGEQIIAAMPNGKIPRSIAR